MITFTCTDLKNVGLLFNYKLFTFQQQRVHVVDTESFEYTFGKKALRKKPNVKAADLQVYYF